MPGADGQGEEDVDYGYLAHQAAARRLDTLSEIIDAEDEDYERIAACVDPPLEAPYCGCQTCDIRETLVASYPIMLQLARAEVADGNRLN